MKRENKGITLIALVITVTVLIILASIATYSGVGIIRQSKLNRFTTEMKIMQTEVNDLYQKATSGETVEVNGNSYTGLDIYNIGEELDSKANNVFTSETSGITDKSGYRLYDQEIIKGLGIDGVEEEYFVNVEKRSIVSCDGFEYEGATYYTLDQLPNGLYNAEYEENTNIPTFDVEGTVDGNKYTITVSNIQYNGYINKWQVKYQKKGQDYWSTSEDLNFEVGSDGTYKIKIANGDIESNEKEVILQGELTQGGLTAKDLVNEDKSNLYGSEVKGYECTNSLAVDKWLIFYVGTMGSDTTSHIYLIADDYINPRYCPNGIRGTPISSFGENALSLESVIVDYAGPNKITDSRIKALNNDYFNRRKIYKYIC